LRAAIVALLLCSLPAQADGLRLTLEPGWIWSNQIPVSAATLRGRAGYEIGWLAPSVAFMMAPSDPGPRSHGGQDGGIQAWGLAAEMRAQSEAPHRFFVALGGGVGQLTTMQAVNGDTIGYRGETAPYVEGALGYEFSAGIFRLGLELTADVFNRVHLVGDTGGPFCVEPNEAQPAGSVFQFCPAKHPFLMWGVALVVGFGSSSK
jgi:hypothetical protein